MSDLLLTVFSVRTRPYWDYKYQVALSLSDTGLQQLGLLCWYAYITLVIIIPNSAILILPHDNSNWLIERCPWQAFVAYCDFHCQITSNVICGDSKVLFLNGIIFCDSLVTHMILGISKSSLWSGVLNAIFLSLFSILFWIKHK